MIPSKMSLLKALYELRRSRNISNRTSYLMDTNFWISSFSREAVPVPLPAWKPWKILWKAMEVVRHELRIIVTTFQNTSNRPMPN